MTDNIKVGGLYKIEWSDKPARVIGLDSLEIFYDCLWGHNAWTFSGNFKKSCYFYRTSKLMFEQKSSPLDFFPLSETEQNAFRPDLPMRFGRSKKLNWNDVKKASDRNAFAESANNLEGAEFLQVKLLAEKIFLIPSGKREGFKKGTILTAENGAYFECAELIWKAGQLQEPINNSTSKGIGIYRIGFEKQLPSFYIGEYLDRAGILSE